MKYLDFFSRSFLIAVLLILSVTLTDGQGSVDMEISKLNSELSRAYSAQDYEAAFIAADKLVSLSTAKFGKESVSTARALKNRGFVEAAKGEARAAEDSLEDAADIFRKQSTLIKTDSETFAELLETLAALKMKRDLLLGEKHLEEALRLRERSGSVNSKQMAFALASLANISFWKREYKRSADQYKRSLELFTAAKNTDSPDFTTAFHRARCAYRKAGADDDFEALKTAYGLSAEFFGGSPGSGKARLIQAGVVNGKAVKLPKPPYPAAAKADRAEGIVEVDVLIDETGRIVSACTANKPHIALAEISEITAYSSKFSPTLLQGKPVKVSGRITYKFSRR
ncbi:MAG: energy transducer TonB [Pyrinomonadaceae bacterium]